MKCIPPVFFIFILFLLTPLTHAQSAAHIHAARNNEFDALSLAIELHNPDHSKALKMRSPEYNEMYDLLLQFDQANPDLKQIRRVHLPDGFIQMSDAYEFSKKLSPTPYQTLLYEYFPHGHCCNPIPANDLDQAEATLLKIFPDAQNETQSWKQTESSGDSPQSTQQWMQMTWTRITLKQSKTFLATALMNLGLSQIVILKTIDSKGNFSNVQALFISETPQDMAYVLNQLKFFSEFDSLQGHFSTSPEDGDLLKFKKMAIQRTGGSLDVKYGDTPDELILSGSLGWCEQGNGDCFGIATDKHDWHWSAKLTPIPRGEKIQINEKRYAMINTHVDFTLISEKGPKTPGQNLSSFWQDYGF